MGTDAYIFKLFILYVVLGVIMVFVHFGVLLPILSSKHEEDNAYNLSGSGFGQLLILIWPVVLVLDVVLLCKKKRTE
jgi:hypothetical protein